MKQPVPEIENLEPEAAAGIKGREVPGQRQRLTYKPPAGFPYLPVGDWLAKGLQSGKASELAGIPAGLPGGFRWDGSLGGTSPAQGQSRLQLHPMVTADFRWQPGEALLEKRT